MASSTSSPSPSLRQVVELYATSLVVFFAVDLLWLGVIAQPYYQSQLGHLLRPAVVWPSALAFYLFFLVGLLVFVILPAVAADSLRRAAALGALYGFITYQTYELTNHALIDRWPLTIVFVDIAWGMVLSTVVAVATTRVARALVARRRR